MKVLCVYSLTTYSLKRELYSPGDIPFGISYIATVLKRAGHDVRLVVLTPTTKLQKKFSHLFQEFRPDLICITSVSSQLPLIKKAGAVLRQTAPHAFIIMGGVHTTLNPDEVINFDFVDAICIGEGEEAIIQLAEQLEKGVHPTRIQNLWIKRPHSDSGIERNPPSPFRKDLDSLPFIDREMWDPFISHKKGMIYTVLAGRGCPNRCTYCSNHALARIADGKYVRFRSPENIIQEISQLVRKDPMVETVFFEIETLGANLDYTYELLSKVARFNRSLERPLKFGTNLALNAHIKNNTRLLKAFKAANLDFFRIGLESGSERIRREVLNRPRYCNHDLVEFCRMARRLGIKYTINVLIGLPGETPEDFQKTIRVTRACKPTYGVSANIFYPYPGTRLHQICVEQQIVTEKAAHSLFERTDTVLYMPYFPPWKIRKEFILFYYNVFKGRKPWTDIAEKTLRYTLDSFPSVKRNISRLVHLAVSLARR